MVDPALVSYQRMEIAITQRKKRTTIDLISRNADGTVRFIGKRPRPFFAPGQTVLASKSHEAPWRQGMVQSALEVTYDGLWRYRVLVGNKHQLTLYEDALLPLCYICGSAVVSHRLNDLIYCSGHAAAEYVKRAFDGPTERPELL